MNEKKKIISEKTKRLLLIIFGIFAIIAIRVGIGVAEQKRDEEIYLAYLERQKENQPVYAQAMIVDKIVHTEWSMWSEPKKIILFKVRAYNPFDNTSQFQFLVNVTALQDGVTLNQTYDTIDGKNCEYNQLTKEVPSGKTAEIWYAFKLDDGSLPVTVRIGDGHTGTVILEETYETTDTAVNNNSIVVDDTGRSSTSYSAGIDDRVGLYSASEKKRLEEKQQAVAELTGWNIAVVTTNIGFGTDGSRAVEFAESYYDDQFGSDSSSIVYLIDLDYRYVCFDGDVLKYFDTSRLDTMLDACESKYMSFDDVGNLEQFYYYLECYYTEGMVS